MQMSDLIPVLEEISNPLGASLARQILSGLGAMVRVGLGYLTLSRRTDTLSGGELQRLKIVRHLGSSLTNITYIFDEPTTGLHHRDVQQLLHLLRRLVSQGNTVIVVEHRLEVIAQADWIIDIGPGAGDRGGQVLFTGTPDQLIAFSGSETARFLRKAAGVPPLD